MTTEVAFSVEITITIENSSRICTLKIFWVTIPFVTFCAIFRSLKSIIVQYTINMAIGNES